ncbi:hypothetical protein [Bacillus sp. PK3_68]|uniref:hypothetical protein n=1 Tax=Bacillus sp. PK3_68 TaxID=2027408 RepID=UPI0015FFCB57|nr:hypothetical protein [Bacillus sp. PK3_68]
MRAKLKEKTSMVSKRENMRILLDPYLFSKSNVRQHFIGIIPPFDVKTAIA